MDRAHCNVSFLDILKKKSQLLPKININVKGQLLLKKKKKKKAAKEAEKEQINPTKTTNKTRNKL